MLWGQGFHRSCRNHRDPSGGLVRIGIIHGFCRDYESNRVQAPQHVTHCAKYSLWETQLRNPGLHSAFRAKDVRIEDSGSRV